MIRDQGPIFGYLRGNPRTLAPYSNVSVRLPFGQANSHTCAECFLNPDKDRHPSGNKLEDQFILSLWDSTIGQKPFWKLTLSKEVKGWIGAVLQNNLNIHDAFLEPEVRVRIVERPPQGVMAQATVPLSISANSLGRLGGHYRDDLNRAKEVALQLQGAHGGR